MQGDPGVHGEAGNSGRDGSAVSPKLFPLECHAVFIPEMNLFRVFRESLVTRDSKDHRYTYYRQSAASILALLHVADIIWCRYICLC